MSTELLDAQQVADQLKCKKTTVWVYAHNGKIDVVTIGRRRWFTQVAVDKFIRMHTITIEDAEELARRREIIKNA
jgi:excisionase family DNA binding protein